MLLAFKKKKSSLAKSRYRHYVVTIFTAQLTYWLQDWTLAIDIRQSVIISMIAVKKTANEVNELGQSVFVHCNAC